MDALSEESTNKPRCSLAFKEAVERKHKTVRAVKCKKMFQNIRCGMKSMHNRVSGVCGSHGPWECKDKLGASSLEDLAQRSTGDTSARSGTTLICR